MKFSLNLPTQCYLFLLFVSSLVEAQKIGIRSHHALACWNAALKWDFGCVDSEVPCLCSNMPYLGTVLACIRERMDDEPSINHAYQYIQNNCKYNGKKQFSFGKLDDIYFNASMHILGAENATAIMERNENLINPVDTETSIFEKQFRAAYTAKHQYDLGTIFGCILIFYWVCIGVMGMSANFILQKYPELLFRNNEIVNSIRKYFILPATFKGHHSRPVKVFLNMTLSAPTRGQSLILLGYFILNIILLFVDYDVYQPNPFLPNLHDQRLRYLGNRTGIIAFTQIPLVILFAARNNIFINLTGWSYDTMQIYHRWVARIMMLHTVIHSVCFTVLAVNGHTVAYRWQEVINWRFGNMATYFGIFMIIFAMNAFRSRFYDVFYFLHKCFYIIFMIGIFRHCWDFGWMGWVYASIAVHLLERAARLYNNLLSGWKNEAYAELFEDHAFRVSVKYSKRWDLGPGQYCYLRVLHKNLFWQAHPFSVYQSPDEEDKNIQFVIKAQQGATRTIANYLSQQHNNCAKLPVMIEGPYGVHAPVEKYETVFLIAGGMGVTATYSYALHLKRLAKPGQRIVFLWVIQNSIPLEWFSNELLSIAGQPNIDLRVHITRNFVPRTFSGRDSDDDDSEEEMETSITFTMEGEREIRPKDSQRTLRGKPSLQKMLPVQRFQEDFSHCLYDKRPNINVEITKFLTETNGNMAIVSCGPPILVDAIRKSITSNLLETKGRIDYFEEAFSW